MHRVFLFAPILLLACSELGPVESPLPLPAGPLQVAAIIPGDVLTVHYHSTGCFHDTNALIVLTATDAGVVASASIGAEGMLAAARIERTLSSTELGDLDRSLVRIRAGGEGWCSTQTSYALRLERGGAAVTDSLHDGICTFWARPGEAESSLPAFTFDGLVRQLDSIRMAPFRESAAGE